VIDNTHVSPWEYASYDSLASTHAYRFAVVECVCPTHEDAVAFAARGTHNVPVDVTRRMVERWEDDARAIRVDLRATPFSKACACATHDGALTGESTSGGHPSTTTTRSSKVTAPGTLWLGGSTTPTLRALYVFDFDATLVVTEGPERGVPAWENENGMKWMKRGWVSYPESLQVHSPACSHAPHLLGVSPFYTHS
jgi:hypothetical protein